MRQVFALVLSLPLLSACVNTIAERTAELTPLVGQPEADVVRRLGVPSRTFETGGHRFLAYTEGSVLYPNYGPDYSFGGGGYTGWGPYQGFYANSFPFQPQTRTCETTFEIADGKVLNFSLRGNAC